ncbi:MAG: hypothetical protein K0S07_1, partial [Chlamydiales bacterium]|nr:hypothetical protein [Chlamydiales bacterium]
MLIFGPQQNRPEGIPKQMHFKSDHTAPAHPHVLEALSKANHECQLSYGQDPLSKKVRQQFCQIFEREVAVFFVSTGTAANCLGLKALCPSYGGIYCTEEAHIQNEECGAPHFFLPGAKLHAVASQDGKIISRELQPLIDHKRSFAPHCNRPTTISLTQASECGTVYTVEELEAIQEIAIKNQLSLHMDGARFANAVASAQKPLPE